MKKNLLPFILSFLFVVSGSITYAQVKGNPQLKELHQLPSLPDKSPTKLSPELKSIAGQSNGPALRSLSIQSNPLPSNAALDKYLQKQGNGVVVDITVRTDISSARAELQKMGMQVTGIYGRMISGIIPVSNLSQLESMGSIQYARPAFKPFHPDKSRGTKTKGNKPGKDADPVISQGDTAQRSNIARNKYNVSGKGVKMGFLSDSYDNLGTARKGVRHGELPGPANPFHYNKAVEVLQDLDSGGTDEGRAMMEIAHDVAPSAALAFHTSNLGQANFAQGIQDLANRGCQVISDDVVYFAEPFFQDGIIAQSIDQVRKMGVVYFSAAGNQSLRSYEYNFQPSDVEPLGSGAGTAHNFSASLDPPVYAQPIFIPQDGTFICSFQWDQSSFSASGVGASSDLDIYLMDQDGNVVAGGASDNIASGDPMEVFGYINGTANETFYLVILKFAGPDPAHIKYVSFGDGLFYLTDPPIPGLLAPALFGHTKAAGAISTAAAFYLETPPYGPDTALVEEFTSVGGTPNYFDVQGNPIAPLVRKKPDITAPDGVNTSFFDPFGDGDIEEDADAYPNFFGTSAAVPHAAGVAALMIEAQKLNTITPDQIRGVLSAQASDIDNPWTDGFDKGFDFASGYGLLRADRAVGEVKFPHSYFKNLKLAAACSDNPSLTRNWIINNPNSFEVEVNWLVPGTSQKGTLTAAPGETTFSTSTNKYAKAPTSNLAIIDWEDNFGFSRVDAEFSCNNACGKEAITSSGGQALQAIAKEEWIPRNTAEIYPNPSRDNFKLYLALSNDQPAELEVSGVDGRILYSNTVGQPNGVIIIPASNYKPGTYFVKLKQGDFLKTFKVIKQ